MNDLCTNEVVDQFFGVNVLKGEIAHCGLRKVGERIQSFLVHFIVLVLDGEAFSVGHTSGIHQLDLDLTELLVILCVIDTEHISSFGNKSETARHRDSCHCRFPP